MTVVRGSISNNYVANASVPDSLYVQKALQREEMGKKSGQMVGSGQSQCCRSAMVGGESIASCLPALPL